MGRELCRHCQLRPVTACKERSRLRLCNQCRAKRREFEEVEEAKTEPTQAEVDRLVAEGMANLPDWWFRSAAERTKKPRKPDAPGERAARAKAASAGKVKTGRPWGEIAGGTAEDAAFLEQESSVDSPDEKLPPDNSDDSDSDNSGD